MIGGTGVFGSRLVKRLIGTGHDVIIGCRRKPRNNFGAQWIKCDRTHADWSVLDVYQPAIVVDASGPFQGYDAKAYGLARAAIARGIHYLDLSDDADFTAGIGELDAEAKAAGVSVLSGVSTVPAISSAIVGDLMEGLSEVTLIQSAILPGNRAPRGKSVMAAILMQVGEPITLWRSNRWTTSPGWSEQKLFSLSQDISRPAALIGAPDLTLFPDVFKARSVLFYAGLELTLFQRSLQLAGWLRSKKLCPNLKLFTGLFHALATPLEPFGTDMGGMVVQVNGRRDDGTPVQKEWRLIAQSGDGPIVPVLAAAALIDRWRSNSPKPGARACICETTRSEIEEQLATIDAKTSIHESQAPTLFERILGEDFAALPKSIKRLHDIWDRETFAGHASVERGDHWLVPTIAFIFRFPKPTSDTAVTVDIEKTAETERWTRRFDSSKFQSVLSMNNQSQTYERFGLLKAELGLKVDQNTVVFPVKRAWLCGIPLPQWLTPISVSREYETDGRFHFDVSLSAPIVGQIVRYRGWLQPAA